MTKEVNAVYEDGKLRLLDPLDLADQAVVLVSVEPVSDDMEREEWHAQSRRSLMDLWDNEADGLYNALLAE